MDVVVGVLVALSVGVNEPVADKVWVVVCGGDVNAYMGIRQTENGFVTSSGTAEWNALTGTMEQNGANMTLVGMGVVVDAWYESYPDVIATDECSISWDNTTNCTDVVMLDDVTVSFAYDEQLVVAITSTAVGFTPGTWIGFTTSKGVSGQDVIGISFTTDGAFVRDGFGRIDNDVMSVADIAMGGGNDILAVNSSMGRIGFKRRYTTGDSYDATYEDGVVLRWFYGKTAAENTATITAQDTFNLTIPAICIGSASSDSEFFSLKVILILAGGFVGALIIVLSAFYAYTTCSKPPAHFSDFQQGLEVYDDTETHIMLTPYERSAKSIEL